MSDPIREWREMDPADRGVVEAVISGFIAKLMGDASCKDHPPDVGLAADREREWWEAALNALVELGGGARVTETLHDAVQALIDAILGMERPWETVANIDALVGPEVSPDVRAVAEAISQLILAIRPVPDLPEYQNDPSRAANRPDEQEPRSEDVAVDEIRKALESMAFAPPEGQRLHAQRAVNALNVVLHEAKLHATLEKRQ